MNRKAGTPATSTGANLPAKRGSQNLMVSDATSNTTGFENMGADDIAIPFIVILQALSPQVRGATKLKNAAEGDFFNTVTSELYKDQIQVIPCAYQKLWVEWVLRENGGGFVRQHSDASILNQCIRNERNQDILKANPTHQIVQTAYHYCLLVKENGMADRMVLSFTSTQLKKSRRWNSQMMALQIVAGGKKITPPMFSHIYTMETIEESNDQGTWAGWDIKNPVLIEDEELYMMARKFHQDVTKGAVKTVPPPEQSAPGSPEAPAQVAAETEVF